MTVGSLSIWMKHFRPERCVCLSPGVGMGTKQFLFNVYVSENEIEIFNFFFLPTFPWLWTLLHNDFLINKSSENKIKELSSIG